METNIKIKKEVVDELIKLGVLDSSYEIAPEAYASATLRKSVDEQANILGVNLIIKAKRGMGSDVESEFIKYFSNKVKANYQNDEGYSIKTLMMCIAPSFDPQKRKCNLTYAEIIEQSKLSHKINEWNLLNVMETYILFNWSGADPTFPKNEESTTYIDKKTLVKRHKGITVEGKPINERTSDYVMLSMKWLSLWRSLTPFQWEDLLRVSMSNWSKMSTGWPDLSVFSEDLGLTLIEIKGTDKVHNNQVFTLLKLKEVLGQNAIAIGWVRELDIGRENLKQYNEQLVSWLSKPVLLRDFIEF
jgi:hypothetical protein